MCCVSFAVDGILLGLQKLGIDFIRVGSLKKVAPPLLRHMVHMSTSTTGKNSQQESEKTALEDLRALLAQMDVQRNVGGGGGADDGLSNAEDRWHVQQAIEELAQKGQKRRKDRLLKSRVMGITIAASEFEIINDAGLRCMPHNQQSAFKRRTSLAHSNSG
jgi:hypothetical protein